MQKSKTESCSHSTLCTRRHNGVQTASAPEDDELTAGVRSRLLWRVQNRIGERQTSFIKQKARCRRQWSNDIQKLDDEYERRVAQLKKDRDQARAKLQNEHHTCDIRLLVVEKQLAEDSKLITSLSGQHHRQTLNLHEFQKQMKPLIQRHKTPISILVPSCVQHKPSSSLGVVIKLKEMRVCSVHEMLRDCFDDIHHAFSVDVASIMTSYIQFKVMW